MGTPPEAAQFVESRKFQILEVARMLRIPPPFLMDLDRATFSNIAEQAAHLVKYTIAPWCERWQQKLRQRLLTPEEKARYAIRFNLEGLLRPEALKRALDVLRKKKPD